VNLEDYQTVFAVGSFALMLVAASPTLALVLTLPSGESFSELWLLGPGHAADNYPFNIRGGEEQRLFVGVGNHLGFSAYYAIHVKLRNQSQPLPDTNNSLASSLPTLYEFRLVVPNGKNWEAPVDFKVSEVSVDSNVTVVRRVTINNETFHIHGVSKWDSEHHGFYYQLFFELWLYNTSLRSFEFHNRFVGIRLNVTLSHS